MAFTLSFIVCLAMTSVNLFTYLDTGSNISLVALVFCAVLTLYTAIMSIKTLK